jgi:hypothetical protein
MSSPGGKALAGGIDGPAAASGGGRVPAFTDSRADLDPPTLRIWQQPQKLLISGLVLQANVGRLNADHHNIRNLPASGHAHTEPNRWIAARGERGNRQKFEQGRYSWLTSKREAM